MKQRLYAVLIIVLILSSIAISQDDFNHPELEWQTIETKHFLVHYHNGAERTGHEIAKIAESIYGPVTSMYGHEPDQKVSFIIRDHDDNSNGAAYFYDNRIEILAPSLDFELRGTHPWLWNVITHEFTHIIQIQTAMKFGRKVPGIYFQWLGYESERRPDVLYGYPNVLVSYPYSGFVVPSWFAEGTAQFNNPDLKYDYWDSHRDMILRMYMINGSPLSWEEMAVFGKTSLGNESSYNAGFSIVEYIAKKYGYEKLNEISRKLSSPFRLTIDGAIEAAIGKTGEQLYKEWKDDRITYYSHIADSLKDRLQEGTIIEPEGFGNFYPVFSPDGSKIAYISNKGQDYFSLSSVYVYDCVTKKTQFFLQTNKLRGIRSTLSLSPDGRFLYYAQITRDNPHWSGLSDLYKFDLITEKEERLTKGLRAFNPKLSPDGEKLVYAIGKDGTLNIGVCDSDGKNTALITKFQNGEQVYTPVWSKDRSKIAFGYSTGHNQKIAMIDTNGENFRILQHNGDSRNPFFSSDTTLIYSWDRNGIFNIYEKNLNSGLENQITNVIGGAFLPTANTNGDIAFVSYTTSGYKIALLNRDSIGSSQSQLNHSQSKNYSNYSEKEDIQRQADQQLTSVSTSSDVIKNSSIIQSRPYRSVFTSITLIPLIRVDNYNENSEGLDIIKPGIYFASSDVLDKINIFGGGAINKIFERDLFAIVEFRDRLPILYQLGLEPTASIELYNITRKRKHVSFNLFINNLQTFYTDITYNLFEFDFSLTQKIISENIDLKLMYSLSSYSQDFGSWLHPTFGVIPSSRSTYFIGNTFSARIKYNGILPTLDRDINPIGRTFSLKYLYERDKFNPRDSIKIEDGMPVPIYSRYNINRLELSWNEHVSLPFPKHTFSVALNAAGILGDSIDEFFDYYTGGFIGMRGYPFYAIGGNRMLSLNLTYRFPISTDLNFRILQLYFKKLFGSVYFDIGNAWYKKIPALDNWKRDVGFELRLEAFSFYAYPTRIFFSGAYGLDKFNRNVSDTNIGTVTYGHEWRFYLGVLFGFELNDIMPRAFLR